MMLLTAAMLLLVVLGMVYMFASTSPTFTIVGGMTAYQQAEAEAWAVDLEWDLMAEEAVTTPILAELDAAWGAVALAKPTKRPMVDRPMRTARPRRRWHGAESLACNPYATTYPALRVARRLGAASPGAQSGGGSPRVGA